MKSMQSEELLRAWTAWLAPFLRDYGDWQAGHGPMAGIRRKSDEYVGEPSCTGGLQKELMVLSSTWVGPRRWLRYLGAGALTLLSVIIVALLWRGFGVITDPGLILLFTVAASTYLAGGMAGMLSAAIILLCSFLL